MAVRPKIGDIIEFKTKKGLAYAQITHRHTQPPTYGWLIRTIVGFYDHRPSDFDDVAQNDTRLIAFFFVGLSIRMGLAEIVGRATVPDFAAKFPLFKIPGFQNPKTRKVYSWGLWDGEKEWSIGALNDEQKKLPVLRIVSPQMLIDRIETGWKHEDDVEIP